MPKHLPALLVIPLAMVITFPALAQKVGGFISGYYEWKDMSAESRTGYVMGFLDRQFQWKQSTDTSQATSNGIEQCLIDESILSRDLVDLVNEGYQGKPSRYSHPPNVVLHCQLRSVCQRWINEERRKLGMDAWETCDGY